MLESGGMKAIVLNKTCNADELTVSEIPIPKVKPNWMLVKVIGFGINRSEIILRDYEANEDYINLPVVPGIECVGEVVDAGDTHFKTADKIISLMGGMGRSFDGSYSEYVLLPSKNVFKIDDEIFNRLTVEEIIAIPETYFTAYGSLKTLNLTNNDSLLIRGATSATGLTAMQIAKAMNISVVATSRDNQKLAMLKNNGADYTIVDNGNIVGEIKKIFPEGVDKVLELIGPKTLENSMKCLKERGICCNTGVLGGVEYIDEFDPIKSIPNNCYLTSFFSNYPTQEIIDDLFRFIIDNNIKPNISKIFTSLDEISDAHKLMESNNAEGKIIFKLI